MTIKEALDIFIKQHIVVVLKSAKVTAVDKEKCTVDLDMITEVEMTDVRLQAGIVETVPGIKVIPKIGSVVTVGMLENNTAIGIILSYTEIEEIEFNPSISAKICGDNLGGLVISEKVNEQINELKTQVNKIIGALNEWG
ncbi:MAG: hypothetical protein N4A41_00555, partial [Crocinitomicaceae bacterium]|nr:hypothetical protein [Crocinitomicaceae bacterium]